jgi:hypothetical protein
VAAWPAAALVGSYELLMMIRNAQASANSAIGIGVADDLAARRVPSVRNPPLLSMTGHLRANP